MGGSSVVESGRERGFLANLFGLYFSPRESFAEILKRPSFWAPLAVLLALSTTSTVVWLQKMEPGEFVQAMLEDSGRWERIPADRRAAILENAGGGLSRQAWIGAVAGPLVVTAVIAVVFLFVFRFFYGGEVTFKPTMTIVCYALLAVGLVQTPLTLLVLALKGDWNLNPQEVLQANPTLLVAKESVARPLYSLLGNLDLFAFWKIGLLAVGCGLAVRRPPGSALWGVVIPWAIFVAGAVALKALIGL